MNNLRMQKLNLAGFLFLSSFSPHVAFGATLPDPASIATPDVTPSSDPKIRENGYKFYYFHRSDVSFEEAYQDLRECRTHLVSGGPAALPGFIPWGEQHQREKVEGTPLVGGLVVGAIAAVVIPKMIRGQQSNKMRRCMGTRGYDRYAIPEETWNLLNEGDEQQLIQLQAKLASGPKPADEAVTR
jgi:hypothetical protein